MEGQFKDPLCYLCLGGAVVLSLCFTQEVVSSSSHFQQKNSFLSLNSVKLLGKTPIKKETEILSPVVQHVLQWQIHDFSKGGGQPS